MSLKQSYNDDQGDDLYGDLNDSSNNQTYSSGLPVAKKSGKGPVHQINIQQEREDITNLKREVERLKKENEVLKRNMGILYRTATKELKRKDDAIIKMKMDLDSKNA